MQFDHLLPFLDGLKTSIFVVDADRQIVLVNDAARALFGEGLMGVDFVQAVRNPKCLNAIGEVLKGKQKSETVIKLQKSVPMTFRASVTKLEFAHFENKQAQPKAIISLEDVSHIYQAEQMRSAFVANVSHELRSPLTSLNGFIETLKGPAKDDEAARDRFLSIMEKESHRMNRLIDDLLSLSKVEADAHMRPQDKIDLRALIQQVVTMLKPLAQKDNVALTLKIPDNINTIVSGDNDQLQQVLINLVENAIKYGGNDGHVTIEFSDQQSATLTNSPALQIDICDNGPGIKAEHIPRLTERFYRVDKGRSREKGGTGLGLAIVKHIIARHRGRLKINSEIGKGSVFTILLAR